jgi:uncharacterized membrane-anchored protein YhcB (DUF1043 family)
MTPKDVGPEIPSPQDLMAFAKEYFKAYMDAIEEKRPQAYPRFAQEAPYDIKSYLLPNSCICMIFNSSQELKTEGATKDWDQVQEVIVKGVDHFAGFFPFEGRSLGDWNKRGKRDAHRDMRLLDKSDLGRCGAELEGMVDNITKMVKANPWLGKSSNEMISTLRSIEGRVKGGFPTVDAIAALQFLKSYSPGAESVNIEFPDKELLQDISDGVRNVAELEGKLDMIENRMFELEKMVSSPEKNSQVEDALDRVERLEKQLEKVSNILTMLNSKVENYFSKSAEKERQADLERRIDEHMSKSLSHETKIGDLEKEAEKLVEEMRKMAAKMEKDIHDSRKRIARMEKHFVDFAKMVQE